MYSIESSMFIQKSSSSHAFGLASVIQTSCPGVEGLGVYKARMLYTYYEPLYSYDDFAICNPQNKNGEGMFNSLLNFLNNPNAINTKQPIGGFQKFEQYKVYPIPTNELLTIEYDFVGDNDATLTINDILGREILQTTLKNENTKVLIPTAFLPQGVYMYEIKVGIENYAGKILKQ